MYHFSIRKTPTFKWVLICICFFSGSYNNTCPVSPVCPWSCKVGAQQSVPVSWTAVLCRGWCFSTALRREALQSSWDWDVPNCSPRARAEDLLPPPREGIGCWGALSRCRNRTVLSNWGKCLLYCLAVHLLCYVFLLPCSLLDRSGWKCLSSLSCWENWGMDMKPADVYPVACDR